MASPSPFADPSDGGNAKPTFVSSPLNPNSGDAGVRPQRRSLGHSSVGTQPPSRNNSLMLGSGPDSYAPSAGSDSSNSSDQMQEIAHHNVGGGFGPYPTFSPSSAGASPSDFRRPSLSVTGHQRFSTISSHSSVLNFSTDSKYAMPFLSYNNMPKDPHSAFSTAAMYGLYDRLGGPEDEDDFIHEPGGRNLKVQSSSWRGIANVTVLIALVVGLVTLFAGYPIISHFTRATQQWEAYHVNETGQIPSLFQLPSLVDPETPDDVKSRTGFDGQDYELVFSDEFNTPGRSFWPGDDPFWEGVNLWYHATGDMEWYSPGQITTRDGALSITIEETNEYPGLPYKSGMLQSWNKFCYTTGYIEVSVIFPGDPNSSGYWPGAWIMGNLVRGGYGATGDGVWPYTYDACDLGTLRNQTLNGAPETNNEGGGNPKYNNNLSWLPGQRLSACTCGDQDHPGPLVDGKFKGRSGPELDIFEQQRNKETGRGGRVSQSVQMAPFNYLYYGPNGTDALDIATPDRTTRNSYRGSALQQALSVYTTFNDTSFAGSGAEWTKFGIEYWSDPKSRQDGYIQFMVGDNYPSYRVNAMALAGDTATGISERLISEEPMSIILNLAISQSFQSVLTDTLTFPAEYRVDYVRVYQRKSVSQSWETHLSCDPPDYPTAAYIARHMEVYDNPNVTTWAEAGNSWPTNSQIDVCNV